MLVRSLRTSHAYNFQDMYKWKSARPTTSRKAGYAPELYTLSLEFTSLENVSILVFQLLNLTLFAEHFQLALSDYTVKPCNFQLDEQIFIHCYFRFGFDTWASILHLTEMRTLQFDTHSVNFATRRVIFQTRPRIFSTQLWNFRFRSFSALSSIMLCEKRGSLGNTQVLPHAKMLLALLKHKADKVLCG